VELPFRLVGVDDNRDDGFDDFAGRGRETPLAWF
jgi:hypothetical protein